MSGQCYKPSSKQHHFPKKKHWVHKVWCLRLNWYRSQKVQLGIPKDTCSRKASLFATSVVRPAPKAPLLYTCGLESDAHLEAYVKAAPLLEIQLGLVKETRSRKTSLCATSSVSPAPKAPLFHNSGLTILFWGSFLFKARLQTVPLLLGNFGACKQTWYRKIGMGPSRVVSLAPKAPVSQKSLGSVNPDLEDWMQPQSMRCLTSGYVGLRTLLSEVYSRHITIIVCIKCLWDQVEQCTLATTCNWTCCILQYLVTYAPWQTFTELIQQVLSLGLDLNHKYPKLFYPLSIGFWEVVRDIATQHVLWSAVAKASGE